MGAEIFSPPITPKRAFFPLSLLRVPFSMLIAKTGGKRSRHLHKLHKEQKRLFFPLSVRERLEKSPFRVDPLAPLCVTGVVPWPNARAHISSQSLLWRNTLQSGHVYTYSRHRGSWICCRSKADQSRHIKLKTVLMLGSHCKKHSAPFFPPPLPPGFIFGALRRKRALPPSLSFFLREWLPHERKK